MRSVRVPDALWDRFAEVAQAHGEERGDLMREWIRWYVGESEAAPPKRPEQSR